MIHVQVFVLTEKSESKQKYDFEKVTKLALSRCGVKVEVSPWLVGRAALDEFLDNHRRVVDHIIRHRLALGMWWVIPFLLQLATGVVATRSMCFEFVLTRHVFYQGMSRLPFFACRRCDRCYRQLIRWA